MVTGPSVLWPEEFPNLFNKRSRQPPFLSKRAAKSLIEPADRRDFSGRRQKVFDLRRDLGGVLLVRRVAGERVHGDLCIRELSIKQPGVLQRKKRVSVARHD